MWKKARLINCTSSTGRRAANALSWKLEDTGGWTIHNHAVCFLVPDYRRARFFYAAFAGKRLDAGVSISAAAMGVVIGLVLAKITERGICR